MSLTSSTTEAAFVTTSQTLASTTGSSLLSQGPPWAYWNHGTGGWPPFGPSGGWPASWPSPSASITTSTLSPPQNTTLQSPTSTSLEASSKPTFTPPSALSNGAKAGLGAGFAVLFVLLLGACAYALRVRRNRKRLLALGLEAPSRPTNTDISSSPEKLELAGSPRTELATSHKSELASPLQVEADSEGTVRRELSGDPPVYQELAGDTFYRKMGSSTGSSSK